MNAEIETELLPCPFCQGTHITDRYVRDGRQMFCQSCGASVAPTYHGPGDDTLKRAFAAWNRRTPSVLEAIESREVKDPICRQCASGEPGIPEKCTCELSVTAITDAAPEMAEALAGIQWKSADRDNMEFTARITYVQMDAIRAALSKAGG